MSCREFIEYLWRYLDDDIPQLERATFEQHLAVCPHCERYLDSYKRTIVLGKAAFLDERSDTCLSEPVPEELVVAVIAARRAGRD